MGVVQVEDNSGICIDELKRSVQRALEIIGGKIEGYAVSLVAPRGPKGNAMPSDITAQLRQSITHRVDGDTVIVGSNLNMAAYVELGTGREYEAPPEWIKSGVQKGPHSGLDHWFFYDEKEGRVRVGLPMGPTPFLRPAVINHKDEYEEIVKKELKNDR